MNGVVKGEAGKRPKTRKIRRLCEEVVNGLVLLPPLFMGLCVFLVGEFKRGRHVRVREWLPIMGVRVLVVSAAVDGPQIRWSTNEKKKEMDFYEHGPYNATISDRHQRPNATRTAADIRGNNVRFPLIVRPPSHPPCRIRTMKLLLLSFFFSYAPADNPSGRQSYRPVSDACPAVRPPLIWLISFLVQFFAYLLVASLPLSLSLT